MMEASRSESAQVTAPGEDIERYEVIDGVRVEREAIGAFETVLASWLWYLMNSFAAGKKLGLAVTEVLFALNAARALHRRPDVAFVSYDRWPTPVVAREPAWNVVPDLAIEIVSPSNLAEEIDRKITDYFQAGVRLVWVSYPDSGRLYAYQSPTHVVAAVHVGRQFVQQIALVGDALGSEVPEVMMRITDGNLRLQGRLLGESQPVVAAIWHMAPPAVCL